MKARPCVTAAEENRKALAEARKAETAAVDAAAKVQAELAPLREELAWPRVCVSMHIPVLIHVPVPFFPPFRVLTRFIFFSKPRLAPFFFSSHLISHRRCLS